MGVAGRLGGLPSLTAAVVICSGIIGASVRPLVLTLCGVSD
jgi:putative effector of murein hydrolase